MQFWIALAAPSILANHNKINSDVLLQFFIFLGTVNLILCVGGGGLGFLWKNFP